MKVSEKNSAEPGGKNAPFPAWVLRYASQPAGPTPDKPTSMNVDLAEEQNYSELSHFEEVEPSDPKGSDSAIEVPSAE